MAQPAMPAALETGAVQGYQSAAPYWAIPIIKGNAVLWISGPKGELPADRAPAISSQLQTTRAYAEANPDLMKRLALVYGELTKAIDERPAEVKAAIAKLFPDLDPPTTDLLFSAESRGWIVKQATVKQMAREIELVKASGIPLHNAASLDPNEMLFPKEP
jgi:ABC-type nitrate/sulfonate/bicarbonate transport system substrate-binding protein